MKKKNEKTSRRDFIEKVSAAAGFGALINAVSNQDANAMPPMAMPGMGADNPATRTAPEKINKPSKPSGTSKDFTTFSRYKPSFGGPPNSDHYLSLIHI